MKSKITAHMVVKNEEQWIWYALNSVLNQVEKIIVYDTGSSDRTAEIIKKINSPKIFFREKGEVNRERLVELRNQMLTDTPTEWFLLLDGDEVWPQRSIEKLLSVISSIPPEVLGIIVRTRNCVGDIFHYQPESAGNYRLLGKKGHLTVRAYKKQPGFFWKGIYPLEAYTDSSGKALNNQQDRLKFLDVYYWHLTHLYRSSASGQVIGRQKKYKLELGIKADKSELPEVFFEKTPFWVPEPWLKFTPLESALAYLLTPARNLKRKLANL